MRPPIRFSASNIVTLQTLLATSFEAAAIPDAPAPMIKTLGDNILENDKQKTKCILY